MPGPPPDPNARRRNSKAPLVQLPAEGRSGPTPKWPLSKARKAEAEIWEELWSTPQAVAWERLGLGAIRTVARYVRVLYEAEKPSATASIQSEARQLEDKLGLTPMSMLRLRWEVVADEVTERRDDKATEPATRRVKAVDGDAVARTKRAR